MLRHMAGIPLWNGPQTRLHGLDSTSNDGSTSGIWNAWTQATSQTLRSPIYDQTTPKGRSWKCQRRTQQARVLRTNEDCKRGLEECPFLSAMPTKWKNWGQRGISRSMPRQMAICFEGHYFSSMLGENL